jgi:NhaP-type Na+/H+ or K+/H+ antiporter
VQIGSGFGSSFASLLKLKARERRILVLAGVLLGNLHLAGVHGLEGIATDLGVDLFAKIGVVVLLFEASIGASLVFEGEKVIGATTYSAVVIMVIVTTLVTPPLLKWTLTNGKAPRGRGKPEASWERDYEASGPA